MAYVAKGARIGLAKLRPRANHVHQKPRGHPDDHLPNSEVMDIGEGNSEEVNSTGHLGEKYKGNCREYFFLI